jgi:hypothetical protein
LSEYENLSGFLFSRHKSKRDGYKNYNEKKVQFKIVFHDLQDKRFWNWRLWWWEYYSTDSTNVEMTGRWKFIIAVERQIIFSFSGLAEARPWLTNKPEYLNRDFAIDNKEFFLDF